MGQKITPKMELEIEELEVACDEIMAFYLSLRVAYAPTKIIREKDTLSWEKDALSGIAKKMSDFLRANPEEVDQRSAAHTYLVENEIVDREWNLKGCYEAFYPESFKDQLEIFLKQHEGIKPVARLEDPDFETFDVPPRRDDDRHFTF